MDATKSADAQEGAPGDSGSKQKRRTAAGWFRRLGLLLLAVVLGLTAGVSAWALIQKPQIAELAGLSEPVQVMPQPIVASPQPVRQKLPQEIQAGTVDEAIAAADELLLVGDFQSARSAYECLKTRTIGNDADRVAFRAAFAAELAGADEESRRAYQAILDTTANDIVAKVALLGRVRLDVKAGRFRAAQTQLAGELLANGAATLAKNPWVREAAHLLAESQAREVLLNSPQHLLADRSAIVFPLQVQAGNVLRLADTQPLNQDLLVKPDESSIAIVHRFGPEPEKTQVAVSLNEAALPDALEQLAHTSGLRLVTSELAKREMPGRSTTVRQSNMSMALILDRLLLPLGMCWTLDGRLLNITVTDELEQHEVTAFLQAAAIRALQQASIAYPDHDLARFVGLHTAMIQFQRGDLEGAIQNYSEFLKRNPRSQPRQTAWFNLAKAQLSAGEELAAINSFYHVIDNGREAEIAHAAYLYIGRLNIELGQYDEAKRPLLMAIALSTDSRVRQLSMVALAASYALNANFSAAAATLAEYNRDIQASGIRQSAELVSQYVRYRDASQSDVVQAGTMLVTSLANSPPSGFLRTSDGLIRSEALQGLGMLKQRAQFLKAFLEVTSNGAARQRMALALADTLADLGALPKAEQWLSEFIPTAKDPWLTRAKMQQVQIAYRRGDTERSMAMCSKLVAEATDKTAHEFALRVMGKIYQSRGDFQNASLCYAGILPPSATFNRLRTGPGQLDPQQQTSTPD